MEENNKKPTNEQENKYTKIKKSTKAILIAACCLLGAATISTGVVCGVTLANQGQSQPSGDLEKKIETLTKQLAEKEAKINSLTTQLTAKEKELEEAKAQITTQTEKIKSLETEIKDLKEQIEKYKTAAEQLQEDLKKAQDDLLKEQGKVSLIFMQGNYEDPTMIDYRITPGKTFGEEGLTLPTNSVEFYQWYNAYGDRAVFDDKTPVRAPMILEEHSSIKITLEGIPDAVFDKQDFTVTASWEGIGIKDSDLEWFVEDGAESYGEGPSIKATFDGNKCSISTLKSGYDVTIGYRHKDYEQEPYGEIRKSESFTIQQQKAATLDYSGFEYKNIKIAGIDKNEIKNTSQEDSKFTITYDNSEAVTDLRLCAYDNSNNLIFEIGYYNFEVGTELKLEVTVDLSVWEYTLQGGETLYLKPYQERVATVVVAVDHPDITIDSYTENISETKNTITIVYTNKSAEAVTLTLRYYDEDDMYLSEDEEITFVSGTKQTVNVTFDAWYSTKQKDALTLVNPKMVYIDSINLGEDLPFIGVSPSFITNVSKDTKTIDMEFYESTPYSGEDTEVHLVANVYNEGTPTTVFEFDPVTIKKGDTSLSIIFNGWKDIQDGTEIAIEPATV